MGYVGDPPETGTLLFSGSAIRLISSAPT